MKQIVVILLGASFLQEDILNKFLDLFMFPFLLHDYIAPFFERGMFENGVQLINIEVLSKFDAVPEFEELSFPGRKHLLDADHQLLKLGVLAQHQIILLQISYQLII